MAVTTTPLLRRDDTGFGARSSMAVLLLVLLVVGLLSGLQAFIEPLWFDEVCTVLLCRLPNLAEIWNALDNAADTNPPTYYYVTRFARQLIPDDHLGYRLPSIAGLLGTLVCIYFILSRRVDRLSALVGVAFILGTPLAVYAHEARPYGLMLGCVSGAILAWQRIDESKLYSVALAVALAAAMSSHYYAILVWPAFVAGETSKLIFDRRFRIGVWVALIVGASPLLFFGRLLLNSKLYYGQNFWSPASISQIFVAHDWLFNFGGYLGWALPVGVAVGFLYWSFGKTAAFGSPRSRSPENLRIEECALALFLLCLPVMAVAAAKLSHGGMTNRYMLPTVLGGALALGYVTSKAPAALRVFLLVLMLGNYCLFSLRDVRRVLNGSAVKSLTAVPTSAFVNIADNTIRNGSLLQARAAATRKFDAILARSGGCDVPVVISSGLQYLPIAYYTPTNRKREVYTLVDPNAALTYAKTDSVDLNLLVLRRYFPLRIEDYGDFASRNPEFLLVSGGDSFDWWPARLTSEGHTLRLLSADGSTRIYKVNLRTSDATASGNCGGPGRVDTGS